MHDSSAATPSPPPPLAAADAADPTATTTTTLSSSSLLSSSWLVLRQSAMYSYEHDVFPLIVPTMPAAFLLLCGYEYHKLSSPRAPRRFQRALVKATFSMPAQTMGLIAVSLVGTRLALTSMEIQKSITLGTMYLGFISQYFKSPRVVAKGTAIGGAIGLGIDLLLYRGVQSQAESPSVDGPIRPYEDDSIGKDS